MKVSRLTTYAGLLSPDSLSVELRMVAVLDDGSQVVALEGRGFSWAYSSNGQSAQRVEHEFGELKHDALTCVGPDEPRPGQTLAEVERDHWGSIAADLTKLGVSITGAQLAALPHNVEIDEMIQARVNGRPPAR